MQDYDVVLKILLQKSLQRLTGTTITRWLSTELPTVQNLRIDLLGETSDRELMQIEVQSTNDSGIPFRMLEYLVMVTRIHGRVPKQILLYVGRKPLHMASQFQWTDGVARFTLVDMREIDGEPLLASSEPSDNVLGILARLETIVPHCAASSRSFRGCSATRPSFISRLCWCWPGCVDWKKLFRRRRETC